MKFTRKEIADSIDFSYYKDLYPDFSWKSEMGSWGHSIEDYMFPNQYKFNEYADEINDLFNSFPQKFPIYRSIRVKSIDDIDMEYLGESWSFDLESAKEFGSHNGSNIMLSAIVNENNVNWLETLSRYFLFSVGDTIEDENEIVVIETNELENVTVSKMKEAKEIGENPIFKRIPYIKTFESWLNENNTEEKTQLLKDIYDYYGYSPILRFKPIQYVKFRFEKEKLNFR